MGKTVERSPGPPLELLLVGGIVPMLLGDRRPGLQCAKKLTDSELYLSH